MEDSKIRSVYILQEDDFEDIAISLDTLLTSEQFRCLKTLHVRHKRQFSSFPRLRAGGVELEIWERD